MERVVNPWAEHYEEANDRHVQDGVEEEEDAGAGRERRDEDEKRFESVSTFQEARL